MKIYRTATQQAYDELMIELEGKGFKWKNGENPTKPNNFDRYDEDIYIYVKGGLLSFSSAEYFKKYQSYEKFIEYKAKGDKQ